MNNLKFYRKQRGLSQEKLSYAVGKSIAYINQVENRDSWPQPEMVDKISVVLGISASALFEEASCPANVKLKLEENLGKSLEAALLSCLEKDVRQICRAMFETLPANAHENLPAAKPEK